MTGTKDQPSSHGAALSAEERELLSRHIAAWRREGLINDEQADVLALRVAPRATPGAPTGRPEFQILSMGRGVTLLVNFGAVILALGLVIFFASNWADMTRPSRVACLLLLTGGFQGVGWVLSRPARISFPKLGVALVGLGCLLFGASIPLIAQMYSLFGPPTQSVAVFSAACFAVAYLVRSRLVLAMALLALLAWFGMHVGYAWGGYWLCFWKPIHFAGLGALMVAAGAWQPRLGLPEFRSTYLLAGLITIFTALLVLSQEDAQDWRETFLWLAEPAIVLLLVLPYAVALALALWLVRSTAGAGTRLWSPAVVLAGTCFGTIVLTSGAAFTGFESRYWWMALLTLFAVAGVWLGLAWRLPVLLNTSIAFLVIDVYTRYFEWFWDALPRSLFFIAGGVSFIVGGIYLERFRRRFVGRLAPAGAPGAGR